MNDMASSALVTVLIRVCLIHLHLLCTFVSLRPLLHAVLEQKWCLLTDYCLNIFISLTAASCLPLMPTGLSSLFLFQLLPVSSLPVFLGFPVLHLGAYLLCMAVMTLCKVEKVVGGCPSQLGKASSATVCLTCSVEMPCVKRSWRVGLEEVKQAQDL